MMASKAKPKNSVTREIVEWIVTLGLAVGLALCVHAWVGELITVEGPSMQPNLWENEKVLVGKVEYYFHSPKRGDIVIVKYPDRTENIIKRVIATAGERVRITAGILYIDDRRLYEPYLLNSPFSDEMEETVVPDDMIFVMGDNRDNSHDSRNPSVGPVPLTEVKGRAYWILWPFDKWAKLSGYAGTLEG